MVSVESGGLARQCRIFLPFLRPVVCHGAPEAGCRACVVLVVESGGVPLAARLRCFPSTRFRFHFRVRLHVDSLHPQSCHSLPPPKGDAELSRMPKRLPLAIEFLRALRSALGPGADYRTNEVTSRRDYFPPKSNPMPNAADGTSCFSIPGPEYFRDSFACPDLWR